MRRAILLSLSLIVGGCVPTADFVELRDQVRQIQDEKRKLKETEAELRKRLEDADRLQKTGDIAKQLDVLEAKIESLRIRQQGFDQKLGELLRRMDESARQEEKEPAPPQAKAPTPGVAYAEMGNAIKARVLLKRVVDEFPQSAEATLARRRLAELR